jgi:NADPH:quinone reductase-like Zn-dependent oxidoreductase
MQAIVYHRYGPPDVVTLAELPRPVPGQNEVLIRIHATTVSTGDWRARSLKMPPGFNLLGRLVFGLFGPRQPILGTELSGVVEAVGRSVTTYKPGDEVFAFPGEAYGCHAEYRTMTEDGPLALKPAGLSHAEAAALSFGGVTALGFLRDKAGIKRGDRVLVVGASGAVGSAAVQLARHFGGVVTGLSSAANAGLVRSLGATKTIDYMNADFTTSGDTWDIILDTTGTVPFARAEPVLASGGRLLVVLASLSQAIAKPSRRSDKRLIAGVVKTRVEDLQFLAGLAAGGEFRPVIDRVYALANAAEAHAYVDTGHKRGSVVLTVARQERGSQ